MLGVFAKTIVSGCLRWVMPSSPPHLLHPVDLSHKLIWLQNKEQTSPVGYSVTDFERTFDLHYIPVLSFENLWTYQKIIAKCNKLEHAHQIQKEAKWWGSYYHEELESGFVAPVYVAWADEIKHWGLFARQRIAKDTFIGEYAGQVQLVSFFFNNLTPYCFHYPLPLHSWVWFTIDPARYGKETRFMNHSEQSNCRSVVMFHKGLYRIGICADRDIHTDEELTFNYGLTVWGQTRTFK